jgi:thioredoxin reductase (NADPH)
MERAAGVKKPVLLAVDDEPDALGRIEEELVRRYASDYRVVCVSSGEAACTELGALHAAGEDVAVVLADQWMPDQTGAECLEYAQSLHPSAKRALLVEWGAWGDRETTNAILGAMERGTIDYYLLKPWRSPDELFHRTVSEFIHEWSQSGSFGPREVAVVGEQWSPRAHELRVLLARNGVPHSFHSSDTEEGRRLLDEAGAAPASGPVVMLRGGGVLVDPSNAELAAAYGVNTEPEMLREFDLIVVGAGPAGLAAAVSASSEGINTLVVERESLGGQAGSSSRIRNYLGFSRGVSGADLAQRAYQQAWVLGTDFIHMREVIDLQTDGRGHVVTIRDGGELAAPAVVLATGVSYRRLPVRALAALTGKGVYYGISTSDARALSGRDVHVVGGGNSAGQAAIQLSRHARRVTLIARESDLAQSMSFYLRREIDAATEANLDVRLGAEVVDGGGEERLERLTVRDCDSGETTEVETAALFVLIGATPHTDWLPRTIARGARGFVLTGSELQRHGVMPRWPRSRPPMPFETSLPGVFAVGDVRQGSARRLAAAVGEGSVTIPQVARWLDESDRSLEGLAATRRPT